MTAPNEERIEKFKFRRQLRKIDWESAITATIKTMRTEK